MGHVKKLIIIVRCTIRFFFNVVTCPSCCLLFDPFVRRIDMQNIETTYLLTIICIHRVSIVLFELQYFFVKVKSRFIGSLQNPKLVMIHKIVGIVVRCRNLLLIPFPFENACQPRPVNYKIERKRNTRSLFYTR